MSNIILFKQYLDLADQLEAVASKDDIMECARLLAMNVAHYESKFGALPLNETLAMLDVDYPNDEQVELMNKGMENLVGVLGSIIEGFESHPKH